MNALILHPKVAAATLGAAITDAALWAYTQVSHNNVPTGVALSIGTIVTFLCGYIAPATTNENLDAP